MQAKLGLLGSGLYDKVVQYLPNLFQAILILTIGLCLALVVKFFLSKLLRMTRLDRLAEGTGAADLIRKGGIRYPCSGVIARIAAGLIIVISAGISIMALNIPALDRSFEKLLLYLPNIFNAGLMLLAGYLLGNFLGRAVLIAAVNSGIRVSQSFGKGIRLAVIVLASTMAMEQLGIGGETVVIAFGVILGGIVLALALALGLGAKDIARKYLEQKLDEVGEPDSIHHL